MKNKIPNRQAICDCLCEAAKTDSDIIVLCSDSRGSASMTRFAQEFPSQFIEVGIAEQNLVGIAAGLASCGKKPFVFSPASFLSTRSYEQIKVDCAYSDTNVKLVGISGGISYGALGMSHHSAQDIAAISAIPNMRVYLPSDRLQTSALIDELLKDNSPAYIRIGRNAVEDVYSEENFSFAMNKASNVVPYTEETEIAIIACGEMVYPSVEAAKLLGERGIIASVTDAYCIKPVDGKTILEAASKAKAVVTVEEHSRFGGLGTIVAALLGESCPKPIKLLTLPDSPVITGTSAQVFEYYGLDAKGIAAEAEKLLSKGSTHNG